MTDFEETVDALAEYLRYGPPHLNPRDALFVAWMFAGHYPGMSIYNLFTTYMTKHFRGGTR